MNLSLEKYYLILPGRSCVLSCLLGMKRCFLRTLQCLCCIFGALDATRSLTPNAPNIVIFLVDDMGWMDTEAYGSIFYKTPNIDRLARQGIRFTDAYAPNPMCSPTRASLLTGKYPSRFRFTQPDGHLPAHIYPKSGYHSTGPSHLPYICPESVRYLDPIEPTLSKFLQSAGYKTGFFGKWHLGLPEWTWPDKFGFDVTWHGNPDNGPPLPHGYFAPYSFSDHSIQAVSPDEHLVNRVTDESLRFIQTNKHSPFFLFLSQFGVHAPWQARVEEIQKSTSPFLSEDRNQTSTCSKQQRNPIMATMIQDVDRSVGKIIDSLMEMDLLNNTFFVFTSDNGGESGIHSHLHRSLKKAKADPTLQLPEWMKIYRQYAGDGPPTSNYPLRGGKGSLYEGGLRIPFIIHFPPLVMTHNIISSTPVSIIDIFPTIHQLVSTYVSNNTFLPSFVTSPFSSQSAGRRLKLNEETKKRFREKVSRLRFDGLSLLPLLKNPISKLDRQELFGFYPHGPVSVSGVSLRSQEWKFIRRFATGDGENEIKLHELYDLSEDISESDNLSNFHPNLVKRFNERIDHFLSETQSLIPIPNPRYNQTLGSIKHVDLTSFGEASC
jgi:arylsulfatase A-like enzyme